MLGWANSKLWMKAWALAELVSLPALPHCPGEEQSQLSYNHVTVTTGATKQWLVRGRASSVKPLGINMAPVTFQTMDVHMAFGGNMGHRHRNRPCVWQGWTET